MKICKNCNTENDDNFIFCRNCGSELDRPTQNGYSSGNFTNQNFNSSQNSGNFSAPRQAADCVTDYDGVSSDEMKAYIGAKNQNNILNKLALMQFKGSKTSWCWPAAVLTFFFGLPGGAMWLLYRKVYKQGFIVAALGFIETLAKLFLIYYQNTAVTSLDTFSADNIWALAINAVSLIATVIIGLFSYKWYKDTAVERIKLFREYNADHPYYLFGISQKGGTSGGMLALAVAIYIVPTFVFSLFNELGGIVL